MISGDLQKAAEVLVNVLLKTQKGETFVITADTAVDASVIEVIGRQPSLRAQSHWSP